MQQRHVFLSPEAHDLMIYGDNSQAQVDYLQQQMATLSTYMGGVDSRLMQVATSAYDYSIGLVNNYDLMAELQQTGLMQVQNDFMVYNTIEQFQNATPLMMRYLMAEPTTRQRWLDGELYGYGDAYNHFTKDLGGGVGEDDYDYRRVMDGVYVLDDGPEDTYHHTHYYEDLIEGDRPLMHDEKVIMLENWMNIQGFAMDSDTDFTRPGGPAGNKRN